MQLWNSRLAVLLSVPFALATYADRPPRPNVIYRPLVLTGQTAPGMEGEAFTSFPYYSCLNDSRNAVFLGSTTGSMWSPDALFRASPDGINLVAAIGQQAPGMADGVQFSSLAVNNYRVNEAGQVIFEATLDGPGIRSMSYDDSNCWSSWLWTNGQLQLVSQWQAPAPGTNTVLRTFEGTVLGDNGKALFTGDLVPDFRTGVWYGQPGQLRALAIAGEPVPGLPGRIYREVSSFPRPTIAKGGQIAFLALVDPAAAPADPYTHTTAVLAGTADDFRAIAVTGQSIPGAGVSLGSIEYARIFKLNNRGKVLFSANLSDRRYGLCLASASGVSLVAASQDPAPGLADATFDYFHAADINDRSEIVLLADTAPGDESSLGIWAGRPDHLRLIAAEGLPAPDAGDGVLLGNLLGPAINKDGQVAFFGYLTGPNARGTDDYAIFATHHNGELSMIARYGDSFEVAPGDTRTIAALSHAGVYGTHIISFNEDSDLSFLAKFTDGSEGIFLARVLPEPSAMLLIPLGGAILMRRRMGRGCH